MGIVGLIVTGIVIATAVNYKIVESIGQWLIKNMVEPFGQLLFEKLVKPIGQWLGYSFHHEQEALGDGNINMIGVWGMAGVGKSTLVREVAKKVKEEKLFDEVAIAIVKQSPDLKKLQVEIAEKLDLKFEKESLSGRADLLRERLTKDKNKKILVILDDIWEKLDLDEIGVPSKGCKVVVTSRDRDILSTWMGTDKVFELQVLPKEEAWSLFEKFSGDSLKDSNLQSKAIEISKACAGLPLALVTVAKALKNKSLFEWEDALQQLRRPSPRNQKRMQEVIYSAIKLSYNHLESPELRSFFLLCAQFQVGSSILYMDLLKKCFGLHLFHGISTLEESRNRIYTLVRGLKDSGLLLDTPHTSQYFYMHDLARDVALLIAYETPNVLMMRDEGPVEWPEEDDIKMCKSISVLQRDIHELPDRLECPELRYLVVYARDRNCSFKISDTFFEGMRKLKVLDLTYMRLSSLPSSLDLLKNLQALFLDHCVLGDITRIGKLKNLELLSLFKSEFKQLPREIGLLTRLQMLDLSNCTKLEVIPPNVLSCLIGLEELYVGNSFTQWEVERLNNERASLAELKHLSQLTTLEKYVTSLGQLPLASFRNLRIVKVEHCEKLKFVFSSSIAKGLSQLQELEIRECSIMGAIVLKEEAGVEDRDMILLPQLRHLVLHRLPKLMSFLSTQKSVINDAGEIIPECDLDFHMPILLDQVVFPNLEMLELSYIDSEELLQNQHRARSSFKLTNIQTKTRFQNLRSLKVEGSGSLKYLLSTSTARVMEQLKYLSIKDCKVMEEVLLTEDLGEEEEIIPIVLFPRLNILKLKDLPVLKRFCVGSNNKFPSLKYLRIEQCPKLKSFILKPVSSGITVSKEVKEMNSEENSLTTMQPLFNEEVSFPSLETLGIYNMENLKIIWHNQLAEDSFFKLQLLRVEFCENLMSIFQSNTLTRFQCLEKLYVYGCGSLQEIFELQGQDVRETQAVTTIPLKVLNLRRLPKMKQVWNKDPQGIFSFPNLQVIYVWDCKSLKSLFLASVARCLMQLKDLHVIDCGVREIVAQEDGVEVAARLVFPKVTLLILRKLSKLKWFYQGVHTSEWPLLKHLEVSGCDQIELFISKSLSFQERVEESQVETSIQQPLFLVDEKMSVSECESITEVVAGEGSEGNEVITFSQLTYLKLDCLPNLTSFCSRSYSFEFPSLEEVIVSKCPKMKIFCHGILSTPKLERVQATKEDEWHWKVDLNTTVRTLALEGQTMIPLCNSSLE
uniref:AAA+ ATPase domain-containing protein n=1 Tax=Fagus sylvatica TaxID=28930 RepID=A0A2N9EFT6_FAGSY